MAIPKKGTTPAGRKSVKMEADELTEKIKACVKEALDEQAEAKAEGEEGPRRPPPKFIPPTSPASSRKLCPLSPRSARAARMLAKSWATLPPRKSWRP